MAFQFLSCGAATARTALDTIRARGFVQCASKERPGLATTNAEGRWSGLEVEICRAIATAVFGAKARFAYHAYDAPLDFETWRRGEDDVAFLTPAEIADDVPVDTLTAGPTIFVETHDLIVSADSHLKRASDLAMKPVCFIAASPANESLDAWFSSREIPLIRYAFREDDEMYDTYAVQRCAAVAGEATELARARLSGGVNHVSSRFLSDHLASFPIMATTTTEAGANWAAIVAATVHALVASETTTGADRLGLVADWRKIMLAQVGDYGAIFGRTLGANSELKLDRGLNQAPPLGTLWPNAAR